MTQKTPDDVERYQNQIADLKAENDRLKQKIKVLEKKCACYYNNQKLSEAKDEIS